MSGLSISTAWEECRALMVRDGKLFAAVALALVALPTAVTGVLNPGGRSSDVSATWVDLVVIVASLIALSGQLALIRLALGPSITVGGAIGHGIRRTPVYLVAAVIIVAAMLVALIPCALLLAIMGVPLDRASESVPMSPGVVLVGILYLALVSYIGVRMILAAPAASAEAIGPIAVLRRSWDLTLGHWWRLFGFLLAFFIGAVVLLLAIGAALGVFATVAFGPVTALSAGALVVALVQALANAVISTLFAVMLARIYVQLAGGAVQASVPSSGT